MENIDEDIKIVEERIDYFKNHPEGCNWKLSFEDDKDIQAIENLLSRLKTAERMNDLMANEIDGLDGVFYCRKNELKIDCSSKGCRECIIEYFRNKAKESE